MATSLPSPPPSPFARKSTPPPPSNAGSPSDLTAKLDHLLANHLHLLDTYMTLRTQLSTDLSSAFFALASANRNAAALLGPGRKFGRDQYDERMKSTLQVEVEQKELIVRDDAVEEESEQEGKGPQAETQTKKQEQMKTQSQQDPNASTCQNESPKQSPPIPRHSTKHLYLNFTIAPASSQTSTTKKKTNTKPLNPLHQFHPLPPPSLRQTQSLFTESVSSTIPPLLTTMSQMKTVEREIWGVRRDMGIAGEYESGSEIEAESEAEAKEDGEEEETDETDGDAASTEKERGEGATNETRAKQKASSKSSVHNLVSRSRPSEPRSRVLKVD